MLYHPRSFLVLSSEYELIKIIPKRTNAKRKSMILTIINPEFDRGSADPTELIKGTIAAAISRDPSARHMSGSALVIFFCIEFGREGKREIIVKRNSSISANDRIGLRNFINSLYHGALVAGVTSWRLLSDFWASFLKWAMISSGEVTKWAPL